MGKVAAHLLDGFEGDQVVLKVDGEIRDSKDDATTSLLIGTAGELTGTVEDGGATVRIEVPTRGLAATQEIELHGEAHMLVSIEDGALSCRVTDDPPGFM